MPSDRRQRTASERDSYTSIQHHKRSRCNSNSRIQDGKMSARQCTSLIPTATDNIKSSSPKTPWKGWKAISSETSPCAMKENHEFPPLTKEDTADSWYTPQPIKNWADFMDEEEGLSHQENVKPATNVGKKQRFKRKLLLSESGSKPTQHAKTHKPILTDEHRLAQRQKQIDYGKNTASYGRYISQTPRHCRQISDPRTPDKFQLCSTRSWTGQIKSWRRRLHEWDMPTEGKLDPFSLLSNSDVLADVDMQLTGSDSLGSVSSTNSSQDYFAGLNLDACLLQDNLPL